MLTFIAKGPERGDASRAYRVTFDKPCTVESFIDSIFTQEPVFCRWGYIKLFANENSLYPADVCEYSRGAIVGEVLDPALLKLNVVSVRADGGWGRMDFYLVAGGTEE